MYSFTHGWQGYMHYQYTMISTQGIEASNRCSRAIVCSEPFAVYDCYIAKICKDFNEIISIRPNIDLAKLEPDEYVEECDQLSLLLKKNKQTSRFSGPQIVAPRKAFF